MNNILKYFSGETRTIPGGIFTTSSSVTFPSTASPGGTEYRGMIAKVVRKTVPYPGFSNFQIKIPRGWRTSLNGVVPTYSHAALLSLYSRRETTAPGGFVSSDIW